MARRLDKEGIEALKKKDPSELGLAETVFLLSLRVEELAKKIDAEAEMGEGEVDTNIFKKATSILEQRKRIKICLEARLCPSCGGKVRQKGMWEDGDAEWNCDGCKRKWTI